MYDGVNPVGAVFAYGGGMSKNGAEQSGYTRHETSPGHTPERPHAVGATVAFSVSGLQERELGSLLNSLAESNRRIADQAAVGGEIHVVPDVLGLTVGAASSKLKEAGFPVARLDNRRDPDVQKGFISRQIPSPGSKAKLSGGVRLIVSAGP